jgi:hypothetical protein
MLGGGGEDHDLLGPALRPADRETVPGLHGAARLRPLCIDINPPVSTGALRFGPSLEEAGHVEPDVEPDVAGGDVV